MRNLLYLTTSVLVLLMPYTAYAYVGPGAGITMLAALWAVIVAIATTLFAILYWPVKSLLRKRRAAKLLAVEQEGTKNAQTTDDEPTPDERAG